MTLWSIHATGLPSFLHIVWTSSCLCRPCALGVDCQCVCVVRFLLCMYMCRLNRAAWSDSRCQRCRARSRQQYTHTNKTVRERTYRHKVTLAQPKGNHINHDVLSCLYRCHGYTARARNILSIRPSEFLLPCFGTCRLCVYTVCFGAYSDCML